MAVDQAETSSGVDPATMAWARAEMARVLQPLSDENVALHAENVLLKAENDLLRADAVQLRSTLHRLAGVPAGCS